MECGSGPSPGGQYPQAGKQCGTDQSASARSHVLINRIPLQMPHKVSQVRLLSERSENRIRSRDEMAKPSNKVNLRVRSLSVASFAIIALVAGLVWMTREPAAPESDLAAPEVTLEFFDGSSQQLSELRGHPVVLNFWASWCPACISEMPAFGEVHRRFGDEVEFIGVNMQEVDLEAAENLVEQTDVDYRLVHDRDGAFFNLFGGISMPTTVFISATGDVEQVHAGALFEDDLTAIILSELLN